MNNESAGSMLIGTIKTLFTTMLKILALIIATLLELMGKFFFWISEQIKRNAK